MTRLFTHPVPQDFIWGVATAAYQIEGGQEGSGRGRANWDLFCEREGAIYQGHTGTFACDHYGHLEEDLDLIAALGVDAYRFSVSWSRLLPEGTGRENPEGLKFYDRLIDGLLARGVTPYLTLFHWDYPQALEDRGGFRNPDSPRWFEDYTRLIAKRYGDRVKHFFTLNEPHAFIDGGLRGGRHAPGYQLPQSEVLLAAHHALLAHGRATQVLRALVKDSWVSFAPVLICATPHTDCPEDLEAARRFTFQMKSTDLRVSSWWMDPCFGRGYPEDGLLLFGSAMPKFRAADLDLIAEPLDAVGFNLYDAHVVRAGDDGEPILVPPAPGSPRTAFNWPITERGHYFGPLFATERYKLPALITENGLSCRDWVHLDGTVPDFERIDFLRRHLKEVARALDDGIAIEGYFHWSLLDNFEWNHGYRERFGLVHVDYETFKRTPKDSFAAYRELISESRQEATAEAAPA